MAKIKWIKLDLGMSDDEKMKIIDSMPERDTVHYVWIRLLIQAGKTNAAGSIFLNQNIPYTKEMLSIIFNRPIELIEFSLKILENLKMIEVDENNIINILNWDKHQNVESMDKIREQTRKRVEKHRAKNKTNNNENAADNTDCDNAVKLDLEESSDNIEQYDLEDNSDNIFEENLEEECNDFSNVTVTRQNKKEIENKKKIEIESERSKETENRKDHNTEIENEVLKSIEVEISSETFSEADILEYIDKLPKKIKGSTLHSIKSAVSIYGLENVKLAIDRALEVNKPRMNYVNGILKNWKVEGYSKDYVNSSKGKFGYEAKKYKELNFNNFEPRSYDYNKLEKALLGW